MVTIVMTYCPRREANNIASITSNYWTQENDGET